MKKFIAAISEKEEIAPETYQITFDFKFESFTFTAGQYVEVSIYKLLYPDAGGNSRFFSITSSPSNTKSISIVFKSSDSGFKKTLIELPLGSEVIIGEPSSLLGVSEDDIIYEEVSASKNTIEVVDDNNSQITSKISTEFEKFSVNNPNIFTSQFFEVLTKIAGITITDKEGTIVYVNEYFSKIAQYSAAELIGQNHRMLKSGLHSPSLYKEMWDTIASGRVWRGEVKNKAKDGSFYWSDSSIAPIMDDSGNITNYVAIRFLITDRKDIEEELRQTIIKLEEREIEYEKVKKVTLSILEDLDL